MSGRVSRDMGQVWFLIPYVCVFVRVFSFCDLSGLFCVTLNETEENDQLKSSFLHYNIPLSLKLINLFGPVSVTRVYPE